MSKFYELLFDIITALNATVKTKTQTLTESQNTQARANIGALGSDYVPPTQTAEQVGADPEGTAESLIGDHNVDTNAHNDIRDLIEEFKNRVNALLDSDDTTLDQLSEIVEYIKNNKDLIEGITTAKVNVADIVDNLTSNITNQPLSAAQGVALKTLIDDLTVEVENKSDLTDAEIDALSAMIQ
jgi:thymidylate synthase